MYEILTEGKPPVKPEAFGGQHSEDHHYVLSRIIIGDGTFNNNQLILLEWFLYLE